MPALHGGRRAGTARRFPLRKVVGRALPAAFCHTPVGQRASRLFTKPDEPRCRRSGIAPIRRVYPALNCVMEGRIRPIGHTRYEAVFDRVVVNVIQVRAEVGFIAHEMLPEPGLPQTAVLSRCRYVSAFEQAGDAGLDEPPAHGKVAVVWRQSPDRMHVVGEDDPRIDRERKVSAYCRDARSQGRDRFTVGKQGTAFRGDDRKKVRRPGNFCAAIVGHPVSVAAPSRAHRERGTDIQRVCLSFSRVGEKRRAVPALRRRRFT